MRLFYVLFLLIVLAIVVTTLFQSNSEADPKLTEKQFLEYIQKGDYKNTVEQFGGNKCRCPKKGGWVTYLVYASAQEPNLAFLMGKPFNAGEATVTPVKTKKSGVNLPWEIPEDVVVDVPIRFDENQYMPLFLPLNMAYGKEITLDEFNKFLENPDKDSWKGFTLRLRPTLAAGAVDRPEASKGIEYKPIDEAEGEMLAEEEPKINPDLIGLQTQKEDEQQEKAASPRTSAEKTSGTRSGTTPPTDATPPNGATTKSAATPGVQITIKKLPRRKAPAKKTTHEEIYVYADVEDAIRELKGEEGLRYFHPRDAAAVKLADGTTMPVDQVNQKLPRLKSFTLRLHIVRRGQLKRWTVYHVGVIEPVLRLENKNETKLTLSRDPSKREQHKGITDGITTEPEKSAAP